MSRYFGMNFVVRAIFLGGSCYLLEPGEVSKGVIVTCAAHFKRRTQIVTHHRPIGLAEDPAAVVGGELHTAHPRRFAGGHAGDGGRDREFDAARTAANATVHAIRHPAAVRALSAR